ncbi:MAG: hypothetical protein JWO38_2590 [Gemmataceae bacterium]|nr:hypothetical protein [Gemmataceae bacterium]
MSADAPAQPAVIPARKPRRWRRRLAGMVVLLAAGIWFVPTVVAKTGLRNRIVRDAAADLHGTVDVGEASFGWLSPVELRDVTVKDAQGRTLLTVAKVVSSKSLLAILRDSSDLGEFAVERPVADVVCETGRTNLEDTIEAFLKDDGKPVAPTRRAVSVRLTGGKLTLRDTDTVKTSAFEPVEATVGVPAARTEPITVKLVATAASEEPGTLDADLSIGDAGSARLVTTGFPLETLAPFLKRADRGTSLAGSLTADLKASWGKDEMGRPTARVEGTAATHDLELAGPWLNGDRLRLASAQLPLAVEMVGKGVRVERADLRCDFGTLSAAGSFDPDEPFDKLVDRPQMRIEADVDLAKLAALVPKLLRIREGTVVRDGKLVVKLASRATPDGTVWDGDIRTSALKAERDGKPIEWAEPLAVEFSGRASAGHLPTFDKFICRSDFIAINAKGSPESFRGAANVYLDRLSARLGEFVDLRGSHLTGEASAWVIASRFPAGAFKADAGGDLKEFAFTDSAHHGLAEHALALKLSAAGSWPAHGAVRIETGSVGLTAGGDTLELKLLEPIPDARQPAGGQLSANVSGDLARWIGRIRGFVAVPRQYVFGGTATASGTVRVGPGVVAVDHLVLGIVKARFRGAGLDLDEPILNAAADLTVNRGTGATEFGNLRITAPVLGVTEGKLVFEAPPDGSLAVSGAGKALTDLNRLGRMLKLQADPKGSDALHGRATGPFRFRWQGDATTFGGTLDLTDFAYGDPARTGISEPALKLEIDGRYEEQADRLALIRARIERPGLVVDGKGTMAKFDSTQDVALDGTLTYDLAKLTPDLRTSLGGGFRAAGQGSRPFSLAGSLGRAGASKASAAGGLSALTADAALGWDSLAAYGFDVGPGEFKMKLSGGLATVSPVRASFGGGQVTLAPSARLAPDPAELTFAKGKVVDRAKLTPAACAGALGYALPVIANAAQAGGELSAVLDDNHVPLGDVSKALVKGQLVIHKATVGPGPVVTEIAKLLGAQSTTMTLANEMTVPVRVEGGRVYHENLSLTVNGYAVKTTGSVGFDGSLMLVADVPIPGTFPGLKNNPVVKKSLEGKIVKVPVTGTVAKPTIDHHLFQAAVANLARDAAKGIGRDLLHKEIEKLFPGMPAPPKQ